MTLSDDALRQRLATMPFTEYNVRLSADVTTRPGEPDFLASDVGLHSILRTVSLLLGENLTGFRAADLGCLEGCFALALAQRGALTLGLDVRAANVQRANLLKDHFDLPNLEFVWADVKDFTVERWGHFDVVLALGLLHHLDDPVRWLRQVAPTTGLLIVDTHFAPDDHVDDAEDVIASKLGPVETMEVDGHSYRGRWYEEATDSDEAASAFWGSYGNMSSFWLTHGSLTRALQHVGFDVVYEQHDRTGEDVEGSRRRLIQTQLVAVRVGARLGPHRFGVTVPQSALVTPAEGEVAEVRATLEEITKSRAWRAVTAYRNALRRVAPVGSRRSRALYNLTRLGR